MTKYINHKNGLVIGSDNIFFLKDDVNGYREYRSIVWPQHYQFKEITGINLTVDSPAQQIIWSSGENPELNYERKLNRWIVNWLNENVGQIRVDWDISNKDRTARDGSIFFKKRTDAIKFVKYINYHLDGMKFS